MSCGLGGKKISTYLTVHLILIYLWLCYASGARREGDVSQVGPSPMTLFLKTQKHIYMHTHVWGTGKQNLF